jgi:mono/diheme cytochrome c family protein
MRSFLLPLFFVIAMAPTSNARMVEDLSPPLAKLVAKNPVASGALLYTQNCYRCHLTYDQTRQGRGMSPENLRKIVENGKTSTQMSGFGVLAGGKLKNSEIEAILSYITTWENMSGPPALAPELLVPPASDPAALRSVGLPRFPLVQGDARVGRVLYFANCSRCHNPDRSGYIGRRLLPPWDGMRPDLFLKATLKGGIPGSLMPAFATDANGKLRPKEIDDVVSFLLSEPAK